MGRLSGRMVLRSFVGGVLGAVPLEWLIFAVIFLKIGKSVGGMTRYGWRGPGGLSDR